MPARKVYAEVKQSKAVWAAGNGERYAAKTGDRRHQTVCFDFRD
jgi:hypothetical protein